MSRNFPDWLPAYIKYAAVTEAPKKLHLWAGVSAIAGALRRKIWVDMKRFVWYPSFYVIFVAKPGVIAKTTSIDIAMDLLRAVPGIKFGPNSITWQALVTAFAGASESFEFAGEWHPMSAITLAAGELGSLLNTQDRDMINLFIELWDGKKHYEKITKMSGNDIIEAPWINMIAATTPHWIAENVPTSMVGGGFTSRCVFVFAEHKERFVPFVDEQVSGGDADYRLALIQDLEHISTRLAGPYVISSEARGWFRKWYEDYWSSTDDRMHDQMLEGYAARKQTHMFKTAMILAASRHDRQEIALDDLQLANVMLEELEADMSKVFSPIGRTDTSLNAERFIEYIRSKGTIPYAEAYRVVHAQFPDFRDFEGIMTGAIRSGQIQMEVVGNELVLRATGK